jgi:uncharacterized DUF497 family protein
MDRNFQFEWDYIKADINANKHGVTFKLASTVFRDPRLLTIADLDHSETEQRWFSIGIASTGALISTTYLWFDADPATVRIRLISARYATRAESQRYHEGE